MGTSVFTCLQRVEGLNAGSTATALTDSRVVSFLQKSSRRSENDKENITRKNLHRKNSLFQAEIVLIVLQKKKQIDSPATYR